jgi:hypothetical protein
MNALRVVTSTHTRRRARRVLFRADRPRHIDRYIDFFGGSAWRPSPAMALRGRFGSLAYSAAS